jgi:glycosyltransferase involved in cell wall biosynthesis
LCNGREVGAIYKSPRTTITISSTITDDEIFEREDTCQKGELNILFVGFIRPEKGLEYLLKALSLLKIDKPWKLTIVGSWDGFEHYHRKLQRIAADLKIGDKVCWAGYVSYGREMFQYMRDSDIFVLPTLSEGTPRVLVEARANSLPVVATRVGGIPTSVTDGKDGLLVPAKDPKSLVAAIEHIVKNDELRRTLIRNGIKAARRLTIDNFIDLIVNKLDESIWKEK